MSGLDSQRQGFLVATFNPFWRYAVALEHRPDLPAIPFFSKAAALACRDQMCTELPGRLHLVLRRRFWRRVEVIAG